MEPIPMRAGAREEKERRGSGAAWTPGAGAQAGAAGLAPGGLADAGSAISALGPAAPGGAAFSPWASYVAALARATGLAPSAAEGAAMALLVVGATAVVGVVSLWVGGSTPGSRPSAGAEVFTVEEPPPEAPGGAAASRGESAPAEAGSGLEYMRVERDEDGSLGAVPGEAAPAPERTADAAAEVPVVTAKPPAEAAVRRATEGPKPKLAPRKPAVGGSATTAAALKPLSGLAGTVGSGFQEVYRKAAAPAAARTRAMHGARRVGPAASGGNALAQARFAERMSRRGAATGRANSAASFASQPFDGSNTLGRSGATPGGGMELGGAGAGANGANDSKSITVNPAEPPKPVKDTKNKTPYQGAVYAAMAALMLGTLLLMVAGKLISQAKTCTGPQCAAMLAQGKALAVAAMGAGAVAAGLGAMISGEHGQMTQGMPFIIGGGVLALQAGLVLAKADQAGEDAGAGIGQAAQMAGQLANAALQGQQNDKVKDKPEAQVQNQQPQRQDVSRDGFGGRDFGGGTGVQ